mgnify:CR=1 FL=1
MHLEMPTQRRVKDKILADILQLGLGSNRRKLDQGLASIWLEKLVKKILNSRKGYLVQGFFWEQIYKGMTCTTVNHAFLFCFGS